MSRPNSTSEETAKFPNQRWSLALAAAFTLLGVYFILSPQMDVGSSMAGFPLLLLGVFGFVISVVRHIRQ
jgi:drug/metabolite transporter (DMT)-like permease